MTRDITVPAADASGPGIYTESAGGRFFTLLSASGPLRLRINQEETQSLTAGASIGPHPQPIRSLVFYNAGEIVTARIYLGDTPMSSTDVQNVVTTSQADTFINTALNPPDGTSLTIANNAMKPATLWAGMMTLMPSAMWVRWLLRPVLLPSTGGILADLSHRPKDRRRDSRQAPRIASHAADRPLLMLHRRYAPHES